MRGIATTFVIYAALALALGACGGSGHSGASSPTSVPLPIASTVPAGQAGTVDCGTLRHGAGPVELVAGPKDAPACFATAFTNCNAATLDYTKHGVDTGEEHVLHVTPEGSSCRVTDDYRHYSAVRWLNKSATYRCATVQEVGGGIVVRACGEIGDVEIPAVGSQ
jgi:hypothetical protein